MGHGAPKKIDSIPMQLIVQIYAFEGLLYETSRKLADTLKSILGEGNDSPEEWERLDKYRRSLVNYNQEYTKAILSLQRSQNRG